MNATVEIDKAGRVVVPKKMRDALHLRAGDTLMIQCENDQLTIEPKKKPRGLYFDQGWPVYDSGGPPMSTEELLQAIRDDREERDLRNMGLLRSK